MKQLIYFLFLNALCLAATDLHAQRDDETGGTNDDLENEIPTLTVSESGDGGGSYCRSYRVNLDVYAANLVWSPTRGDFVTPRGTPEIYVKVSYGDLSTNPRLVRNWRLVGHYGPNNEPLYQALLDDISIDYEKYYCESIELPDSIVITHQIVMQTSRGEFTYPVCDYNASGQVYSCDVFSGVPCPGEFTASSYLIGFGCNEQLSTDTRTVKHSCDCENQAFTIPNTGNTSPMSGVSIAPELKIGTQANPFDHELQLSWTENTVEEGRLEITVFNTAGQPVGRTVTFGQSGNTSFDLAHLPPGIYFVLVQNGVSTQTIKAIKR